MDLEEQLFSTEFSYSELPGAEFDDAEPLFLEPSATDCLQNDAMAFGFNGYDDFEWIEDDEDDDEPLEAAHDQSPRTNAGARSAEHMSSDTATLLTDENPTRRDSRAAAFLSVDSSRTVDVTSSTKSDLGTPFNDEARALSDDVLEISDSTDTPLNLQHAADYGSPASSASSETWHSFEDVATTDRPGQAATVDSPHLSTAAETTTRTASLAVEIPTSTLLTPLSFFEPFEPGAPIRSESVAVGMLLPEARKLSGDYLELDLNDFAVYNDQAYYGVEMKCLHQLDTKFSTGTFYFDGELSAGDKKYFVRGVPIVALPIENYGDPEEHTVRGSIWVQSALNSRRELYYRLGKPAKEYIRFHEPFLWAADLAKHFVDFLQVMGEHEQKASLHHFRADFASWLKGTHGQNPEFLQWLSQKSSDDFRTSIVANLGFLHKEAFGVLGHKKTYYHAIWDETWHFAKYKGPPKELAALDDQTTVVTPYIYECFEHLPFGDRLKVIQMSSRTNKLRNKLIRKHHLEMPARPHEVSKDISSAPHDRIRNIKPGDTISTHRDAEDSGTEWKREVSRGFNDVDRWFALVQKVHVRRGKRYFDVTWYYRPVDTLCGLMKYPWNNELFLSDHCSCGEKVKITEDEVLGVHDVDFHGTSATSAELFCRQTYVHAERKWITLEDRHRRCEHMHDEDREIPDSMETPQSTVISENTETAERQIGDTYLLHLDKGSDRSEPCELVSSRIANGRDISRWRRLLCRHEIDADAPNALPNELVYSETFVTVQESARHGRFSSVVLEPCYVRFFPEVVAGRSIPIPTPYDRDGIGSYFFITHRQVSQKDGTTQYEVLRPETLPVSLKQGHDPAATDVPRLRGLDLFCGGGNFGRGLEDGGGIRMRWANDYDGKAIHTYMANAEDGSSSADGVHPFLGSIDVLQRLAIEGKFSPSVPEIGKVDFISAGSPCPGFSRLTNDKTTIVQRKNQSLVAAFASFVDLYRPRYGLLENVPGIVQKRANRDQDVFSQLICAIVGLGYQTQFFFLDASACGSPQRRSRVFLAFAAPGCILPERPQQTHSHPPFTRHIGLGRLPDGNNMAERLMPDATPFKFVSAAEATADLPPIYDGKADICVPFPDHRIASGQTKKVRLETAHIPTRPYGINFAQAWYGPNLNAPGSGAITASERASFFPADKESKSTVNRTAPKSNAWGRQDPTRLLETVVTRATANDAKTGRQLHWKENRLISVMEARRAQGFLDEDVILGNPTVQARIVGNSVARPVALALGLVFREAWAKTLRRGGASLAAAATQSSTDETFAEADAIIIDDSTDSVGTGTGTGTDSDDVVVRRGNKRKLAMVVDVPPPPRKRDRRLNPLPIDLSHGSHYTTQTDC